jgi:hypothetical protein
VSTPAELIVYACPTGALAAQVLRYYEAARERCGANSAHAYPPHITLTGFFHDDAAALPLYVAALGAAHAEAMERRPAEAVRITAMALAQDFHGLLIESPWLEALSSAFKARAASPTRRDPVRPKSNLHLSLAYGFRPEHGPALADLARALVDAQAPTGWELRLYERRPDGGWTIHEAWPLLAAESR